MSRPPSLSPWTAAATRLAGKVNRRSALGAALRPVGWGLVAGSLAGLGWRFVAEPGAGRPGALVCLGAGLLVGLWRGIRAIRRRTRVGAGDAAWALDRLADAGERGLTAAVVEGPAAAEAAWASPAAPPPPSVKLLPPRGLAVTAGALLVGLVALLAPERPAADDTPPWSPGTAREEASAPAPGQDPAAADANAAAADRRARSGERVLEALGMRPDEPVDPAELSGRLEDPEQREAALEAARESDGDGSRLADLLGEGDTSPGEVAEALATAQDQRHRAQAQRRAALAARQASPRRPVPLARRALVARYLERIAAPAETGGGGR